MTLSTEDSLISELHQGRAALAESRLKEAALIGCSFAAKDVWQLKNLDEQQGIPQFQRALLGVAAHATDAGFWRMAEVADHVRRHVSGQERAVLAGQPFDDIMALAAGESRFMWRDPEVYGAHFESMVKLAYGCPAKVFRALLLATWCKHPRDMNDLPFLFNASMPRDDRPAAALTKLTRPSGQLDMRQVRQQCCPTL